MDLAPSREQIEEMVAPWMPSGWKGRSPRIHTDTTDFFSIEYGDVVLLGQRPYLIRNSAREGRFGLDDDVKHWVKRAIDLEHGDMCIIKLVFYEKFVASVGGIEFECFRSPRKEARILALVHDHDNFMHGISVEDEKGNPVRILDYIRGESLGSYIDGLQQTHEEYFHEIMPGVLKNFIESVDAIRFLHVHGEKHGDIRRDHILIDRPSGRYRWIDFDYNYRHRENIYGYDLFGIGNILIYIVGKGDVVLYDLHQRSSDMIHHLHDDDLNIVFQNRVANLKKVYPYIPDPLNQVLLHFSKGTHIFYEHTEQLIQDLQEAITTLN